MFYLNVIFIKILWKGGYIFFRSYEVKILIDY